MAARLIRPLYVRLDARTGKAEMARQRPASTNGGNAPRVVPDEKKSAGAGAIKVQRDDKAIVEERKEPFLSPPPKSSDGEDRREPSLSPPKRADSDPVKVVGDGQAGTDEYADAPLPPRVEALDDGPIEVRRERRAGSDEYAHAPVPPYTEPSDDSGPKDKTAAEDRREPFLSPSPNSAEEGSEEAPRRDKIVIEELEREHQFRAALGLMAKARTRTRADESLDTRTIIRIAAAVIVLGLGFTALLPSVLTRDPIEPTVTLTTPAPPALAAPAQTEQAVAQPVPAPPPAPLPEAAPAAPPPNDVASVAKTTPALRGSSAPAAQGEGRATAQAVPNTEKAARGLSLTAAERAAVTRGLQELEKRPAVSAPVASAPRRPALSAEERAAVERGLRELEKTPGQIRP